MIRILPALPRLALAVTLALGLAACEKKAEDGGEKKAEAEGANEEGAAPEGEAKAGATEGDDKAVEGDEKAAQDDAPAEDAAPAEDLLIDADISTIQKAIQGTGKVTLVNAWATWCAPCVEEFPYLVKLRNEYADQGLEVIFVSADFDKEKAKAVDFLQKQGVDFPSYRQAGDEEAFINGLNPDWDGALPATFIYDASGKQITFHPTSATYEEFEAMVKPHLAATE